MQIFFQGHCKFYFYFLFISQAQAEIFLPIFLAFINRFFRVSPPAPLVLKVNGITPSTPADLQNVSPGNCWRRVSTETPFGGLVLRIPLPWKTALDSGLVWRARARSRRGLR